MDRATNSPGTIQELHILDLIYTIILTTLIIIPFTDEVTEAQRGFKNSPKATQLVMGHQDLNSGGLTPESV